MKLICRISLLALAMLLIITSFAAADCAHQVKCGTDTCTLCGESGVTGTTIHTYARSYYSDSQHVVKCTSCGHVYGYENHSYYCSTKVCSGCNAVVSGGNVQHSWGGSVKLDDQYHINTCTVCGAESKEKHEVTSSGACTGCNATGLTPTKSSGSSNSTNKTSNSKPKATPVPKVTCTVYVLNGGRRGSEVTVETLGITECVIVSGEQTYTVPTSQLEFDNEAPEGQKLATIYAPRAGKVSLRKTTNSKSAIRAKCESGVIVTVLKIEDDHAYISYAGKEGYVPLSSLVFYKSNEAEGTAMLHYKDKTNGKNKINVRTTDSTGSFKVMTIKSGTVVNILSHTDKWYQIEYNGRVGYVQKQFINVLTTVEKSEKETDAEADSEDQAEKTEAAQNTEPQETDEAADDEEADLNDEASEAEEDEDLEVEEEE